MSGEKKKAHPAGNKPQYVQKKPAKKKREPRDQKSRWGKRGPLEKNRRRRKKGSSDPGGGTQKLCSEGLNKKNATPAKKQNKKNSKKTKLQTQKKPSRKGFPKGTARPLFGTGEKGRTA